MKLKIFFKDVEMPLSLRLYPTEKGITPKATWTSSVLSPDCNVINPIDINSYLYFHHHSLCTSQHPTDGVNVWSGENMSNSSECKSERALNLTIIAANSLCAGIANLINIAGILYGKFSWIHHFSSTSSSWEIQLSMDGNIGFIHLQCKFKRDSENDHRWSCKERENVYNLAEIYVQ